MIFISILIIIVAIALPSIKSQLSSNIITRISAIIFIYSGVLSLNALHIHTIGSGIGIYSGLFHVTIVSQTLDAFLLIMASLILVAWPLISTSFYSQVKSNLQVLLTSGSLIKTGVQLSSNGTSFMQSLSLNKNNSFSRSSISKENTVALTTIANAAKVNTIGSYTPRTEYCIIVLFSALGSSLLISSSDLLSMYLSIELQSFGLYILATLYRDYESATASGLKYFLLGALSSCFILLGSGLIYSFTGLTNFESIYSLLSVSHTATLFTANKIISGVSLGLILIFIGFLFKIAAAPLHSWSPDVYDETPTQVTIWLTIIPKISILVLLLELQSGFSINSIIDLTSSNSLNTETLLTHLNITSNMFDVTYNTSYVLKMLLLVSSLFSLVIGTVVGLAQTRIKRLLAYSTISHVGFILLALAINTEQSTDSFIFYILQYSLTNLNVFLIIIALGFIINSSGIKWYSNSKNVFLFDFDIRYLSSFKGLFFSNPILSISLAICLFSMSGIPPLLGFFSKQFVLLSAVQSGYWFMALVGILTSVISASYYLRIVVLLFTAAEAKENTVASSPSFTASAKAVEGNKVNRDTANSSILTNFHSFLISTITLSILLFIFKPTLILNSTQLLALSYFNY